MMERFERLSSLFVSRLMNPVWEACGDVEHDGWASLRLFLSGYAFERQGRSPDYAPAATDTVDEMRARPLAANVAAEAWTCFAQKLNNEGLNHANNPLCPRGVRYVRYYGGQPIESTTRELSAVEFAAQLQEPLVAWARDKIQKRQAPEAHEQLRSICGIDVKIASLFLRDVGVRYKLAPVNDRYLLQPIDTWVEFVIKRLAQDEAMDRTACAKFIVGKANAPERANQGMWYFCVPVAGSSRYVVRRCLDDNERYEGALARHLASLGAVATAVHCFNEENAEQSAK
ncbi:MAG: hypothetical protein J7M08_06975 [Planctomycetes bacterium]|nr:hypothetical protein [Planctomycetota bacterium]